MLSVRSKQEVYFKTRLAADRELARQLKRPAGCTPGRPFQFLSGNMPESLVLAHPIETITWFPKWNIKY